MVGYTVSCMLIPYNGIYIEIVVILYSSCVHTVLLFSLPSLACFEDSGHGRGARSARNLLLCPPQLDVEWPVCLGLGCVINYYSKTI